MVYIWDGVNKQWLEPMSIHFDNNGLICKISACKPGAEPLGDGYYNITGEDINKVSIVGQIKVNNHILANDLNEALTTKPIISKVYSTKGEYSHWNLYDSSTQELLWSEKI
jgi:uncharacterized phage-associated protein